MISSAGGSIIPRIRAIQVLVLHREDTRYRYVRPFQWATIKHKKGALDAKRGKIAAPSYREISMAAKSGGDPDMNPRLRTRSSRLKSETCGRQHQARHPARHRRTAGPDL